uniref:Uncharacterized protein n=1 Tax=Anguilla anguilla TaxID=7936 RepID=A0A0E9S269_ANGAN
MLMVTIISDKSLSLNLSKYSIINV